MSDPTVAPSPADPPSPEAAAALAASLGPADVAAAAARIEGRVHRTPTVRSDGIDALVGAQVFFKCENLQRIGAFKARGAMHAVGRLDPELRAKGIITFSSGNHAQAVALAAKEYDVPATIAMPVDAPQVKVAGVRALGATIVFAGTTSEHRKRAALQLRDETGATVIQPFDHPDIVCGQGTATAELLEDAGRLDAIIVPVGGGGVIAGACLATRPDGDEERTVAIHSVEPVGCDALAVSLEAGQRVPVEPGPTLGDGLKPVMVGSLNFEIARRDVATSHRVDDEGLGRALVHLLMRAKVLVEPSGAAGLAALLAARRNGTLPGERIGVILTGGNVEHRVVGDLIQRYGWDA